MGETLNPVAVRLRKAVEERYGGMDFLRGCMTGAATEIDRLQNENARLVISGKVGGSHACLTCASHLLVIEDLRSLIRRMALDGWGALAPHEKDEIAMIAGSRPSDEPSAVTPGESK